MSEKTVVHWFRKDLRLHDNLALRNAINEAENRKQSLRPLYILDPDVKTKMGTNRLRFLLQSLHDLDKNLRNINSKLYVLKGKPLDIMKQVFDKWQVDYLTVQKDIEPEYVELDEAIEEIADAKNIFVVKRVQSTVFDIDAVLKKNKGNVPMRYQKLISIGQDLQVKESFEINKRISDECIPKADNKEKKSKNCYNVPELKEYNVDDDSLGAASKFPGGETEGLRRMYECMEKKDWICKFEKTNTPPTSLEPSTTALSPYISHGCLSAKLLYHKIKEVENGSQHTLPPESLMGQLMWREFYYVVGSRTKNFDRMVGNPICAQISWNKNEEHLKAWAEGRTGYPFVDAIMRQLKQEGWIHHLGRKMVGCFLTRGDLWLSWEEGAKVFKDYLLDYDWSISAGNWMWSSASCFFRGYYSVYGPVACGKKTDKEGLYVKKYVPELKNYPSEYIYEPWAAPESVQKTAGCIIGVDYPMRIVDHSVVLQKNLQRMNQVYKTKEKKSLKRPHYS